jgi:antitoxin component YwqK of YwqJK toxin-antitoxin module
MRLRRLSFLSTLLAASVLPIAAHAGTGCELDGQAINLDDGKSTAGKSGLIRCYDRDGAVLREEQLQNGVKMGIVRHFRAGVLYEEYTANARGNHEGRSRRFAATPGAKNQVVHEENVQNGNAVGIVRDWYPDGTLMRLGFHDERGLELSTITYTVQGKLNDLRCTTRPVFAPEADDAALCGFRGGLTMVELFDDKGNLRGRFTHDHGARRKVDAIVDGKVMQQTDMGAAEGGQRNFNAAGVKINEIAWVVRPAGSGTHNVKTLERDWHESGTLIRERRWTPTERGSDPALDESWYLNGQMQTKTEWLARDGQPMRHELEYHDNGQLASDQTWRIVKDGEDDAVGVFRIFDETGKLRGETTYDAHGRVTHEREVDADGKVTRDDQVFEDGSRKAFAR